MDIEIKKLSGIVNDIVYRIYPRGYHLDIGNVYRSGSRWLACPSVRGESMPNHTHRTFNTRREAIAWLTRVVDYGHNCD